MEYTPKDVEEKMRLMGEEVADKKAAADFLEESKKVIFAKLCNQSNESTSAAKEKYAYAHKEYHDHIKVMVDARNEANKAHARYLALQAQIDCMRSIAATERAAYKG